MFTTPNHCKTPYFLILPFKLILPFFITHFILTSTMSTKSLSNYKKPSHRRRDSDELDVFEAERYFSNYNDNNTLVDAKVIKQAKQGYLRQGRASLDIPSFNHQQQQHYYKQYHQNYTVTPLEQIRQNANSHMRQTHCPQKHPQKQQTKENKKYKQPSSPSGKLAQFLNSLFNQKFINSTKNKKQPKTTQSMKDDHEHENPRDGRRSSISHILSSSSVVDSKSVYSSSSSGFRTPPPYTINISTPTTKPCQNNVKTLCDYKQVLSNLSKYNIQENGHSYFVEKPMNYDHGDKNNEEKKREIKKMNEEVAEDDCGESDASSDLFELQIDNEFGFSSSNELPVYETTHLGNFNRNSSTNAITHAPIKI